MRVPRLDVRTFQAEQLVVAHCYTAACVHSSEEASQPPIDASDRQAQQLGARVGRLDQRQVLGIGEMLGRVVSSSDTATIHIELDQRDRRIVQAMALRPVCRR